ncbi:arsenite methyltransferase-like [Acanthaster planci]|uniref:Arsenite methyltransferase n=1 Tax=Acanthaster planci TaxID=133434 RepID=A0A8B7ZI00_ACAPL|nr:arsenite methyltransferase-like [Acanthaster planci]XP_022102892.1 arsenite methyltransferase-like [Acanthaster planci]
MADKTEQDYKTEMVACLPAVLPPDGEAALAMVHPDIIDKSYCCGLRYPDLLNGIRVLSLGCGFVRDCYVLSKLIGQEGLVVGVDPNDHVISFCGSFLKYHRKTCGFSEDNIRLVKCEPDGLIEAGLQKDYFDLICFNTVLGLTQKKREIMNQLGLVLKTGGEVFFTEMVASSRIKEEVKKEQSLWGEGLAGAFYFEDLVTMAQEFGFSTPRLVQSTDMRIKEPELENFIGGVKFSMATYRMFKLPHDRVDQTAVLVYNNPQMDTDYVNVIKLDSRNTFQKGAPVQVDAETAAILRISRFASVFKTTREKEGQVSEPCPTNPFVAE